jgi:hypothetical protein
LGTTVIVLPNTTSGLELDPDEDDEKWGSDSE